MTKKAKIINQLESLSVAEKETAIAFFSRYPVYENKIDWNNKSLTFKDFEKVFTIAEVSRKKIKQESKSNPELLFQKYNCRIVSRTEEFFIVTPLDWECAVFINSFNCGGEGAKWCIGDKNNFNHWNYYVSTYNLFYLVIFSEKHLFFGKKILIQYNRENDYYFLWSTKDKWGGNLFPSSNKILKRYLSKYYSMKNKNDRDHNIVSDDSLSVRTDILLWYSVLRHEKMKLKQLFFQFDIFENFEEKFDHIYSVMAINGLIHCAIGFDIITIQKNDLPKQASLIDPKYSIDFVFKNVLDLKTECKRMKDQYEKKISNFTNTYSELLNFLDYKYDMGNEDYKNGLRKKLEEFSVKLSEIKLE